MNNEARIMQMQTLLQAKLKPSLLEIIDDSHKHIGHAGAKGGAGHFTIKISSAEFNDKNRLECHKMIYQALDPLMPYEIHALSIKIIAENALS